MCHKVNLPGCETRRRHYIMTCDTLGTGQTNILGLCSSTQGTEINTLDQITGNVIDVSRTYIPPKALTIPLKRAKLRDVV